MEGLEAMAEAASLGKDPTKVDRSGSYMARYIAKNIVAAGLADKCDVQIAYAIGVSKPVSVMVYTYGTGKVSDEKITEAVLKVFDMRPKAIIEQLKLLLKPLYRKTAVYGHFGRDEPELHMGEDRSNRRSQKTLRLTCKPAPSIMAIMIGP